MKGVLNNKVSKKWIHNYPSWTVLEEKNKINKHMNKKTRLWKHKRASPAYKRARYLHPTFSIIILNLNGQILHLKRRNYQIILRDKIKLHTVKGREGHTHLEKAGVAESITDSGAQA